MLIVKPRGQGMAPYDVPSILDFNEFGDVEAYRDHAPLAAHSLQRFGDTDSQEISVAVHNFADAATESVSSFNPASSLAVLLSTCPPEFKHWY